MIIYWKYSMKIDADYIQEGVDPQSYSYNKSIS